MLARSDALLAILRPYSGPTPAVPTAVSRRNLNGIPRRRPE
jgi:hypothetical protein